MKIYSINSRSQSLVHTKYPKYDFNGNITEKAYLIGFRLGDLNVYRVHELIQVRCSTTIKEQMLLIQKLLKKYGNVHVWKAKRGTFEIIVLLNKSFDFLIPKNDVIEDWIMGSDHYFFSFLAGYADAEGSYYLRNPYYKLGKYKWGVFEIQTYDKSILLTISKHLFSLGVENTFSRSKIKGYIERSGIKHNKDSWRVTIVKKQSLWNFIKLIEPFHKHQNKLRDLTRIKNNLLERNTLPYCKAIILQ